MSDEGLSREFLGLPPLPAGVVAARDQFHMALRQLMRADSEGWPAHLAQVVGAETGVDENSLEAVLFELGKVHDLAVSVAEDEEEDDPDCPPETERP